jgi:DNA-directed RNA polymerase specialized sigma24 family protein
MGSPRDQPLADIEAFVALYREHAEALLVFFARRTLDAEAAADLTGETFAQALASRHRFRDHGDGAAPWLYCIAQHQLSRFYRRGKAGANARERLGMPARAELSNDELQRIEELIDLSATASEVRRAMADLPGGPARRGGIAHRRLAAVRGDRRRARMQRAGRPPACQPRSPAARHHDPIRRELKGR